MPPRLFTVGVDTDPLEGRVSKSFGERRRAVAFPMASELGIGKEDIRSLAEASFPPYSSSSSTVDTPATLRRPFAPNVSIYYSTYMVGSLQVR